MTSSHSPHPPRRGRRSTTVLAAAIVAVASLVASVSPVEAQVVEGPVDPAVLPANLPPWIRGLRDEVESLLPRNRWPTARWGVLAVSLHEGDTLVAADPDASLAPASNVKLLTTAAALDALGPDFRYTTYLLADGQIVDGVLRGDLILLGTGDPTLSDAPAEGGPPPFTAMARRVRDLGIRRVDGNVVGDASLFPGEDRAPGWNPDDYNDDFAAPSSALAYTENVVTLRINPAPGAGARPSVQVEPAGAPLEVVNEARTLSGSSRSTLQMVRRNPVDPVRLVGGVGIRQRELRRTLTVPDPALHAAAGLRRALEEEGVVVVGHATGLRDPARSAVSGSRTFAPAFGRPAPRVVAHHRSPPLSEILTVVNHRSHNLYADMVARTLGRILKGDGSYQGGAGAVASFVERRAGVPEGVVELYDGSGLSRMNRATAGAFVEVLRAMAGDALWPVYLATLPEAGGRSLRRMQRSAAAGNLRAKTGTIRSVSALSGVVRSVDGEPVLFSILANGLPSSWAAKDVEDRIGIRLAGFSRPVMPDPASAMSPAEGGLERGTGAPSPGVREALDGSDDAPDRRQDDSRRRR